MPDDSELERLHANVETFRDIYVSFDALDEAQESIRMLHRRRNVEGEGGIVLVVGEARSGKSRLLRDYAEAHPDEPRAILGPNGEVADRKSVIYMKVPDASDKNVAEAWMAALMNQTIAQVRGMGRSGFGIKDEVCAVARAVENRMALLDEAHQAIHRSDDKTAVMAVFLKDIVNRGIFSITLAGTSLMMRLLDANAELAGRVFSEHEVKPFDWDDRTDRGVFLAILEAWDDHFREHVFGKVSGLTETGVAWALHAASSGYRGIAANIVEVAAKAAVGDMAVGKAQCITFEHLARAFARMPQRRIAPKAFEVPPPVGESSPALEAARRGAAGTEAEGIQTRLRGRTRRSDRHRIFRP